MGTDREKCSEPVVERCESEGVGEEWSDSLAAHRLHLGLQLPHSPVPLLHQVNIQFLPISQAGGGIRIRSQCDTINEENVK
jgi:hypothetical protein